MTPIELNAESTIMDADCMVRTYNVLRQAGLTQLSSIAERTRREIAALPWCGKQTMQDIETILHRAGLAFCEESVPTLAPIEIVHNATTRQVILLADGILTQSEVARQIDVSHSRVRQIAESLRNRHGVYLFFARSNSTPKKAAPRKITIVDYSLKKVSPDKLRQVRIRAGFSQQKLADQIGCPKSDQIREWENGTRKMGSDYLMRWMLVCKCQPKDLI